jgi:hypothetical protein
MKRIFGSCTILLLGLAVTQTLASAEDQETPGLEGIWYNVVTPVDCIHHIPTGAPPFHLLLMFSHDGSLTTEAAFPVGSPLRSSAVGGWQHTQGHMYTATFRFFRYKEDGPGLVSFLVNRLVTVTIVLNGDQLMTLDSQQDFDADYQPIPGTAGCAVETGRRLQ